MSMLEALGVDALRTRLGFEPGADSPSDVAIANAARACAAAWRTPPRQRITTYLNRQLAAMGFDDDLVRDRVRDVIDTLLAMGDFAPVRLDGKASITLAMPTAVEISTGHYALLGEQPELLASSATIARHRRQKAPLQGAVCFSDWIGEPGYRQHRARRGGDGAAVSLSDFWAYLISAAGHEGLPIDAEKVRIVGGSPSETRSFFGRHHEAMPSGRWSIGAGDGAYCAVRPGRSEYHWHPILLSVSGSEGRALDLYDWDEWNWALLARGLAHAAPERHRWDGTILAFEHPLPGQYQRALSLLGMPAHAAWTWSLEPDAYGCFQAWHESLGSS